MLNSTNPFPVTLYSICWSSKPCMRLSPHTAPLLNVPSHGYILKIPPRTWWVLMVNRFKIISSFNVMTIFGVTTIFYCRCSYRLWTKDWCGRLQFIPLVSSVIHKLHIYFSAAFRLQKSSLYKRFVGNYGLKGLGEANFPCPYFFRICILLVI